MWSILVSLRCRGLGRRSQPGIIPRCAPSSPIKRCLSGGSLTVADPPENITNLEEAFPVSLFRNEVSQKQFFKFCGLNALEYSYNSSYLLRRLAEADVSTVGPENLGLKAVTMAGDATLLGKAPLGFPLMPYTIFKRDFYSDFLQEVYRSQKVLILGTAGVSKSTWQFVYLHSLLTGTTLRSYNV
jgi:hypothetical protein